MHDQELGKPVSSKSFLGISLVLLALFAAPCPSSPVKSELVLKGNLDCKSGELKTSMRKGNHRTFANFQAATETLKQNGITDQGIEFLTKVLGKACDREWLSPVTSTKAGISPTTLTSSKREPPQLIPGSSTVIQLKRKGDEVEFTVSNTDIAPTADSLGSYLENVEGKSGCWQVTDDPACFKCPDGTGFCISKPVKK